jgi:hypothetical protein
MATTNINNTIKGLNDIQATLELKPLEIKPLTLNTKSEMAVTQPIVTNSTGKNDLTGKFDTNSAARLTLAVEPLKVESDQKTAIDLKPLVVDACQTLKLAPLPATCIEQPYNHRLAFALFGIEFWAFSISGESETGIHSPDRRHSHSRYHSVQVSHGGRSCDETPAPHSDGGQPGHGLRVRIGNPPEVTR